MTVTFTSPTGRLVWGNSFKVEQKTDQVTRAPRVNAAGQPLMACELGVAFPKSDPATAAFLALLRGADKAAYPQFHGPDGNPLPGVKFADKITDGDGYDSKGRHNATKDGHAGCWIVAFSNATGTPPTSYKHDGTRWAPVMDGIKPGDYVQISGSTSANNSNTSPGMYRNVDMVAFIGHGTPIVRASANPDDAFGAAPPPTPPGATAQPQAPAAPAPGAVGAPPAPTPVAPPAPAAPPPPAASAPYDGYIPGPVMTDKAGGQTREQFHAAGWTDAQLVEHGYMVQ